MFKQFLIVCIIIFHTGVARCDEIRNEIAPAQIFANSDGLDSQNYHRGFENTFGNGNFNHGPNFHSPTANLYGDGLFQPNFNGFQGYGRGFGYGGNHLGFNPRFGFANFEINGFGNSYPGFGYGHGFRQHPGVFGFRTFEMSPGNNGFYHGSTGYRFGNNDLSRENSLGHDNNFEKGQGHRGQNNHRQVEGSDFHGISEKDGKGETGFHSDFADVKNGYENAKSFQGASQFGQSGKRGGEEQNTLGHKKGRVTKGFETSHHKDETGKTTTYFDVAKDEGDRYNFGNQQGSFGDSKGSSYHSDIESNKQDIDTHGEKGRYNHGLYTGKENFDKLIYGNKVYHGSNNNFGENADNDHLSQKEHSEVNRALEHYPYFY